MADEKNSQTPPNLAETSAPTGHSKEDSEISVASTTMSGLEADLDEEALQRHRDDVARGRADPLPSHVQASPEAIEGRHGRGDSQDADDEAEQAALLRAIEDLPAGNGGDDSDDSGGEHTDSDSSAASTIRPAHAAPPSAAIGSVEDYDEHPNGDSDEEDGVSVHVQEVNEDSDSDSDEESEISIATRMINPDMRSVLQRNASTLHVNLSDTDDDEDSPDEDAVEASAEVPQDLSQVEAPAEAAPPFPPGLAAIPEEEEEEVPVPSRQATPTPLPPETSSAANEAAAPVRRVPRKPVPEYVPEPPPMQEIPDEDAVLQPPSALVQDERPVSEMRASASQTPPLRMTSPVADEEEESASSEDDEASSRPPVGGKGKRAMTEEEARAAAEEENLLAAELIQKGLDERDPEIEHFEQYKSEDEDEDEGLKRRPDTLRDDAVAALNLAKQPGFELSGKPAMFAPPPEPKTGVAGPSVPPPLRGLDPPAPVEEVEAEQEDEGPLDLTKFEEINLDTDAQYPPVKHRTPAIDDAESGVEAEPRYLLEWLGRATNLSPALAAALVRTPQGIAAIMETARAQAAEAALAVSTRWSEKMGKVPGLTTLDKMWRWTTAYTDVTHSADFRRLMAGMEFPADASGGDPQRIMDTTRDFLNSMLEGVGKLEMPEGGNREDLDFVKNRLTSEINAAMRSLGTTAYGEDRKTHALNIAKILGTLAVTAMPFAYAYYSEPTAFFYIVGLSGAYLRTALLATGMMFHTGTTGANIWEHVKERQLIWALPAAFYSIQQYMITYAHDHPANEEAHHLQKVAEAIITNTGFLAGVGIVEFGLFAGTNHPDAVRWLWQKVSRKSKSARLAQGKTLAVADDGTADDLRKYFKAGSTLIDVFAAASGEWTAAGERMSDAERQNLKEMRVDMARLGGTLELVIGGVTKPIVIDGADDDEEAQHKSIMQRVTDFTVGAGKAVWNMPQAIRDLPTEKKAKIAVGILLSAIGAVLGLLSSLGAIRIAALLTDYIPYYLASVLLLVVMMFMDSFVTADVARTFGSYFGGTMIGLIPSIINLVSEFAANEGFFDIVGTTADPHQTNSTFTDGHPALPITDHAGIHGASGRINFGVIVAATMIAIFPVGGRLGGDIANKTIGGLKHATGSNDGDSEGRITDADDDDAETDRRDNDRDAPPPDALTKAPKTDLGIAPPSEAEPFDPESASKNLKDLGKEVPPALIGQIEQRAEAAKTATNLAFSLRPKGLKFDPANPPAGASQEEIDEASMLARQWGDDLRAALAGVGASKGASTSAN